MSDLPWKGWIGVLVLASSLLVAELDAAELDDVNLRLLEQYDTPLRWDNVEGPPRWISGAPLSFEAGDRLHVANLGPGQSVYLKLPPFSMLRVVTPRQKLRLDDIEIWLSDGSGLYVQQAPSLAEQWGRLVNRSGSNAGDGGEDKAIRVRRVRFESSVFCLAARILDEVAPYRKVLRVCNSTVKLRGEDREAAEYFRVSPKQPRKFFVEGPTRIAFETRMHYPLGESRLFQSYRVTAALNGNVFKHLEYETSGDFRQLVWVDGCVANVGRCETAYLNIPAGRHAFTISATAPVFVRLLQQEIPAYHRPRVNAPFVTAEQVLREGSPLSNHRSLWDISPEDIQQWADAGPRFVAAQEQIALFSARNNEHRGGGMQGWMLMRRAAAQRPDYPTVHAVAEKLRGFHTHFRDLLPTHASVDLTHRHAWFHVRRLRGPREPLRRRCPRPAAR